jgi:hypothetical protein
VVQARTLRQQVSSSSSISRMQLRISSTSSSSWHSSRHRRVLLHRVAPQLLVVLVLVLLPTLGLQARPVSSSSSTGRSSRRQVVLMQRLTGSGIRSTSSGISSR